MPVTGSVAIIAGSAISLRVSWRVLLMLTPAATVPVAGLVSRAIGWLRRMVPSVAGFQLVSAGQPVAGQLTRNCITCPTVVPCGEAPAGEGGLPVFLRTRVAPGATEAKSMITS